MLSMVALEMDHSRVVEPGYHILNNHNDVQSFTVEKFNSGSEWLPKLGIPFITGLIR